jgi:hypothetical protein
VRICALEILVNRGIGFNMMNGVVQQLNVMGTTFYLDADGNRIGKGCCKIPDLKTLDNEIALAVNIKAAITIQVLKPVPSRMGVSPA